MSHSTPGFAEELPVGVCRLSDRLVVRDVNSAFLRLFGLSRTDCLDRAFADLVPPAVAVEVETILKTAQVERTPGKGICEIPGPATDRKIAAFFAGSSGKDELVVVVTDVTAEHAEMASLRDGLRSFHEFLDQSPFIAWIRDAKERYVYINDTYRQHYGLQPRDRLGRTPFDVWPSETAWQFHRNDMRVLAAGVSRSVVEHAPDPDGTMRTWFNVKFPISSETAGTMIGGVGLDITSHEQTHEKMFAERLRTEREKVEEESRLIHIQQLQSLSLLVSGTAHDINNMLAAIQVYSGVLKHHHATDPEVAECVDRIGEATDAALRLSRRILSMYRRSGPPTRESLDLSDLVTDLRPTLEAVIRGPHQLQFDLASDLPAISGDTVQLRQVVMNLVVNAGEALADSPGEVCLSTRVLPAENGQPERVECRVTDTGPGIPPEIMPRIFEPFFTTKQEGTGLGLAAVQAILTTHEARIDFESELGHGTTVRLTFPIARA